MTGGTPAHGEAPRRAIRLDLVVAVTLATILTASWTLTDWSRLSRMLLPDSDDMMRLAQVRDWLAGQGINDWTQYRIAPPAGVPMHWSRINDLGIAALILAAIPLVGQAHAELIAVLIYPALLFACALFLSARIGRRLWGAVGGPVAAVLTALAQPGTTVFIPGRIDHHALQVVLVQLVVLTLIRSPSLANGAVAGVAAALSLVIGLEAMPHLVVLIATMTFAWIVAGDVERRRLTGFAGALAATTLAFVLMLRPTYWRDDLCDAFTPASASATLAGAAALAALAFATRWLPNWRARLATGGVLGILVIMGTVGAYPACLAGPYGGMDPFLRAHYMPFIEEANSIFAYHDLANTIAMGGLLTIAAATAIWMVAAQPRNWRVTAPAAGVVLCAAILMLSQVRATYIGAPLAGSILAGLVVAARRRTTWRTPSMLMAWILGAGPTYLEIPRIMARWIAPPTTAEATAGTSQRRCAADAAWAQIDRYPPGVAMAAINNASYLIGATHHSTIGAGYHRNDRGIMAMYRFFLATPDQARVIGQTWHARYVLFCPDDFAELDIARTAPLSLAARLSAGDPPDWLQPVPLRDTRLAFYRLR